MRNKRTAGFNLLEVMVAVAVLGICFLGTLSVLAFARLQNELEQQRTRAHQIVSQALEIEAYELFTYSSTVVETTIWDNGTPDDPSDDTMGWLVVIVSNPDTGEILFTAPDPAIMVQIEATVLWYPQGTRMANSKFLQESVITCKAP
ncbi:prepilin-type N-terminal cleavage/methylation domain-containing protein [Candidatus Sumerlaeota bacterium]